MNTPSSSRARPSALGLPAGAVSARLRQAAAVAIAAERYDLSALRLGSIAPPTRPRGAPQVTARDGDLARVDAQMRYARLTLTRQQQLAAARPSAWQELLAGRSVAGSPTDQRVAPATNTADHPNTPAAARRRVAWGRASAQIDHLREDQALNNTIGQGIGYGFAAVAAEMAPQVALLRLAGGLRWAGAARAAVVAGRMAEQASWAGAEGQLIGGRAAWQGYKANPQAFLGQAVIKGVADYGMQATANYVTGSGDPLLDVNILESIMAGAGIRPVAIGIGSAAVNLNARFHLKTVLPVPGVERIPFGSFAAQAGIGVAMGYGGGWAEHKLGNASRTIALGFYMNAALRVGPRVAYPLGLGLSHVVPHLLGTTEEALEGTADNYLTDTARTAQRP